MPGANKYYGAPEDVRVNGKHNVTLRAATGLAYCLWPQCFNGIPFTSWCGANLMGPLQCPVSLLFPFSLTEKCF
eukprot:COSAG02_NODE_6948_length_3269_cov_2.137855_5_plen_74_part_00